MSHIQLTVVGPRNRRVVHLSNAAVGRLEEFPVLDLPDFWRTQGRAANVMVAWLLRAGHRDQGVVGDLLEELLSDIVNHADGTGDGNAAEGDVTVWFKPDDGLLDINFSNAGPGGLVSAVFEAEGVVAYSTAPKWRGSVALEIVSALIEGCPGCDESPANLLKALVRRAYMFAHP